MSAGAIVALVIVLVVIAVVAAVAGTMIIRRAALRRRFGSEYDRLAQEIGPRRATAELAERRRRMRFQLVSAGQTKGGQTLFRRSPCQQAQSSPS